jgi:hypothetical protein
MNQKHLDEGELLLLQFGSVPEAATLQLQVTGALVVDKVRLTNQLTELV